MRKIQIFRIPKISELEHWQIIAILLAVYDFLAVNLAYFAALLLRYDLQFSSIPSKYLFALLKFSPIYGIVCILIFKGAKLYNSIWRFASYTEVIRVAWACLICAIFHSVSLLLFSGRMPYSYYLLGAFFQYILILGIRLSFRLLLLLRKREEVHNGDGPGAQKRVMIIGAGAAGQMLMRDIQKSPVLADKVVCFIDDNPNKWHRYIEKVKVVGGRKDILQQVSNYKVDKIFLAIPSASAKTRSEILEICKESGCEIKTLPGYAQMISGAVTVSDMKDVAVEDLLGREPVRADLSEVFKSLHDKTVLVTGGGGSIGSELCRQIAAHEPRQLIILDIYENNAYDIQLELKDKYPTLNLLTLIGSVRDSRKLWEVFNDYKPDIVYHAAAHKHVPLMEDSPCEAIKNNVIGTWKTAWAALHSGVKRFVLISTDKAVNPTNIMGASKRICEMIIQTYDTLLKTGRADQIPEFFTHEREEGEDSQASEQMSQGSAKMSTEFVAVRFGNVLGSNGSVIPIFKHQIEKGGPVTVTHPDIIRYFMTIPEAVSLVLLAGTLAQGGEIFVLDMGTPVKIDTMARNLIKLSGYTPDVDIPIVYTGLRPGEKLYEEPLMAEEGLRKTENELINITRPLKFNNDKFIRQMQELMEVAYNNDEAAIRAIVKEIVPEYKCSEERRSDVPCDSQKGANGDVPISTAS